MHRDVFGTAHYPSQDPSAWSLAPLAPSVGMTRETYAARPRNARPRSLHRATQRPLLRAAPHPVTLSGAASGNASRAVDRVLRASAPATNSFAVFGTAHYLSQDPSTWSLAPLAPSVGMTRTIFIFRDPSVRAALPRLLRMTERRRAPLFRPAYRRTPSPKGEGKNRRPHPLQNVRSCALARGIGTNPLSLQTLKKGKITLFPFFPCEYTDEGEVSRRSITGVPLKIIRVPENRSAARFLGKRSGRRNGQGGKRSASPAMAP